MRRGTVRGRKSEEEATRVLGEHARGRVKEVSGDPVKMVQVFFSFCTKVEGETNGERGARRPLSPLFRNEDHPREEWWEKKVPAR